jgi:hypothetical protein
MSHPPGRKLLPGVVIITVGILLVEAHEDVLGAVDDAVKGAAPM